MLNLFWGYFKFSFSFTSGITSNKTLHGFLFLVFLFLKQRLSIGFWIFFKEWIKKVLRRCRQNYYYSLLLSSISIIFFSFLVCYSRLMDTWCRQRREDSWWRHRRYDKDKAGEVHGISLRTKTTMHLSLKEVLVRWMKVILREAGCRRPLQRRETRRLSG